VSKRTTRLLAGAPWAVASLLLSSCAARDASPVGAVAEWQVDSAAVFTIGLLDGDSVYQLYRVQDVAELPDSGVVLVNGGTSELRLYDTQGRYLRTLGVQGEGPGEFTALTNVIPRGDTLYAYDRMSGRLTLFLQSGSFVRDVSLRTHAGMSPPTLAGLLGDGSAVGWVGGRLAGDELASGFQRSSAALLRIGAGQSDTLGEFPGAESNIQVQRQGSQIAAISIMRSPFNRTFLAGAGGDRIYASPTDSAVIRVWDGAGGVLQPLRWEEAPRPIDDALVEAIVEREIARLDGPAAEGYRRSVLESPRPPTAPVFDKLLLGPDGEVWVRRFADPGAADTEWLVFGADQALCARVHMPHGREIRAVGRERVYTLERDEYDVEYVRAYPVRR